MRRKSYKYGTNSAIAFITFLWKLDPIPVTHIMLNIQVKQMYNRLKSLKIEGSIRGYEVA
jgi:hypothetical protein